MTLRAAGEGRESAFAGWQLLTGHRFPDLQEASPESFCSRCGLSLESYWGRGRLALAALMRTRCQGPYREGRWLRVLRWLTR